jgi:hypothetical protein
VCSDHFLHESVDKFFSVTVSSESLCEGVSLDLESTERGTELEWPEEVVDFLEFWTASDDFMDDILNTVETVLSKDTLDNGVVGEWDSASIDFTVTSLVDELLNGVSGWETESNKWFDHSEHVPSGLVELDEDTVVQLSDSKELQDLLWLRSKLVDTKGENRLEQFKNTTKSSSFDFQ